MRLRGPTAALLAFAVAGCIGGGDKIEAIYTLAAVPAPPVSGATSAQILVPEPRALEALSTAKIPVKPTPITLAYYPAVALEDQIPKVLQRMILDTFQNTGRVQAVGLPGESLLINYQVVTEIRAFQAETFGANQARIEVYAKLLDDSNGRVIANRAFAVTVPIGGDAPEEAAEGLNLAAQTLATDVVGWTLDII